MIIKAPNKQYNGLSASVRFVNGVGETEDPHLIDWFKSHGYKVEEDQEEDKVPGDEEDVPVNLVLEEMSVEVLTAYAENNGIDIGKATSKDGILKKIEEAKGE